MIAFHDGPTKIFRWEQRLHAPRSGPLMVAEPGRAQGVGLPRRNNSTGRSRESWYFRAGRFAPCVRTAIPHLHFAPVGVPPGQPQTRFRRVQAQLPSPFRRHATLLANFCLLRPHLQVPSDIARERRGPSAGDGLGNRGTIRAGILCREREHGGTQAVSRRSGSPRWARSEGPKVLLQQNPANRGIFRR